MLFWVICGLIALIVAAIIASPLLGRETDSEAAPEIAFYRAQLDEIDRDVAREVLSETEAATARVEVSRRLLAADQAQALAPTQRQGPGGIVAVIAGLVVIGTGLGLYAALGAPGYPDIPLTQRLEASSTARATRPNQAAAVAQAPSTAQTGVPEEYLENVAKLRALMPEHPENIDAWRMLAHHEEWLANYADAARAQGRVVTLLGDDVTIDDLVLQLDLMVKAANGYVSPEAEAVAKAILEKDPENIAGIYYYGEMYAQTDRPDLAFRLWRPLAENGDPAVPHVQWARLQIEEAAFRAGEDYALPAQRGPTAADIEGAAEMSDADRAAMIGNMVAGLADRLASQGGPAEDWARLITAYGVLGQTDDARAIWVEAADLFGANPEAMEVLRGAATGAGVAE